MSLVLLHNWDKQARGLIVHTLDTLLDTQHHDQSALASLDSCKNFVISSCINLRSSGLDPFPATN